MIEILKLGIESHMIEILKLKFSCKKKKLKFYSRRKRGNDDARRKGGKDMEKVPCFLQDSTSGMKSIRPSGISMTP
jgi:hypothetical protein